MSKNEFENFKEHLKKSPKERLLENVLENEKENIIKINQKIADILIDEYHINELVYMIPITSISGCLSYPKYGYESKSVDTKENKQLTEDNQDEMPSMADLPTYGVTLEFYPYMASPKILPNIEEIPNSPIREEDGDRIAYTVANFISNEIVDFLVDIGQKEEIDYEAVMEIYTNGSCDTLLECFKKLRTNIYRRTFQKYYPSYLIIAPDVYDLLLNEVKSQPECGEISKLLENTGSKTHYCGTLMGMKVFVSSSLSKGEYLEGICHPEDFLTSSIMWTPYMLLSKKEDTGEYVSMYDIKDINPQLIVRSQIRYFNESLIYETI